MKLKNSIYAVLFLLTISNVALSQLTKSIGDVCHVYVVDVEKATKALEDYYDKLEAESQIVFPTFITKIGEEEETVKTYPLPKSKWFIRAKVFYTDESLYSEYANKNSKYKGTDQLMILTIAVSQKKEFKELIGTMNSSTEVTYDENTNKVRTKQFVVIDKKEYLVGLECDCSLKNQNSK